MAYVRTVQIRKGDRLRTATDVPGIYHEDVYMGGRRCMSASKEAGRVTFTPCPIGDPTLQVFPAPNNPVTRSAITARMASLENYPYSLLELTCQDAANYAWYGAPFSPQRDALKGVLALVLGGLVLAAVARN